MGTVESSTGLPSFLYLPPEHESSQGGFDLPWRKEGQFAVGEWARRQSADHPERTVVGGQVVAVSQPRRSPSADPALECARRSRQSFPGHRVATLSRTPGRCLGSRVSRRASSRAASRPDRAGVVRRRRPRIDSRSGAGGRFARRSGAVRGTASGRLCLAGQERRRVAQAIEIARPTAGVRRRRRHDRPHADQRRGRSRRIGAAANGGRQALAGRRRQHGPGTGPLGGRTSSANRESNSIPGNRSRCGIRAARRRSTC